MDCETALYEGIIITKIKQVLDFWKTANDKFFTIKNVYLTIIVMQLFTKVTLVCEILIITREVCIWKH